MIDLAIGLEDRPGALAELGEALGRAGVSIEGGGAWVVEGRGVAHFLVADPIAAARALEAAGIRVLAAREVVVQRLRQDRPGQLGLLTRRMADAGVNIEVLYSDHDHRLVLVVDDPVRARQVSTAWAQDLERCTTQRTMASTQPGARRIQSQPPAPSGPDPRQGSGPSRSA